MVRNRDTQQAWTYHNSTKHSWASVRGSAHYLDWGNQPRPFKQYIGLEAIPLPQPAAASGMPAALEAIVAIATESTAEKVPDLEAIARVLYFSAGITRRRSYSGGEMLFRAAACTGALYEFELYLVCGDLPGLAAGVYHFSPLDFALRCLRAGDWRGALALAQAPAVVVCAGTYWRNAWKYQARTYRHFGWDNGTLLANLLAEATALDLPAKVVMGFADDEVNQLLGLDTRREVAFSLVALGRGGPPAAPAPGTIPPLAFETEPLSRTEVDYPAMREMHAASSLGADEVPGSAGVFFSRGALAPRSPASSLLPPRTNIEIPRDSVEEVILRRGSSRQFARAAITLDQLTLMLDRATRGVPADFEPLNDLYLVVNAVEGLKPGAYFFRREESSLELLKAGAFRDTAGYLALQQELAADCSAAVFFLADLAAILERYGNRGYRAAQLEAGIMGGKLYLGAYAQRLGATGLTFFDDDVVEFFSPHAARKSAIFLTALGHRSRG